MRKGVTTFLCSVLLLCDVAHGFSQNFDVRKKSNITVAQLDSKLKNSLKGTGRYFIEAQNKYGINAEFLAAIAIHESGNGKSVLARRKNNFFGLMGRKGALTFSSPKECIDCVAKNLTKKNGYYYGKGRYTISSIGRKYASDRKWSTRIVATMKTIR